MSQIKAQKTITVTQLFSKAFFVLILRKRFLISRPSFLFRHKKKHSAARPGANKQNKTKASLFVALPLSHFISNHSRKLFLVMKFSENFCKRCNHLL